MGTPLYPPDWATKLKEIDDRIKAAFTAAQSRVRFAKILADLLTVGEGTSSIIIDPVAKTVRFTSVAGDATITADNSSTSAGVRLDGAGQEPSFSFATRAAAQVFGYFARIQAASVDGDCQANVTTEIEDSTKRAVVTISAVGAGAAAPGDSRVDVIATGGMSLPDLAANPSPVGIPVIYTVGNSLRWKDPAGVVHVIV